VIDTRGDEVFFRVGKNIKLSKIRNAYATKVGKDLNDITSVNKTVLFDYYLMFGPDVHRFLYDGARTDDNDTPASLGTEWRTTTHLISCLNVGACLIFVILLF